MGLLLLVHLPLSIFVVSLLISPEGAAVEFQADFGRCHMLAFLPSLGVPLCADNALQTSCDPAAASLTVGLVDLHLMERHLSLCCRFYLGGPTSVRGFSMHSIGPQSEGQ